MEPSVPRRGHLQARGETPAPLGPAEVRVPPASPRPGSHVATGTAPGSPRQRPLQADRQERGAGGGRAQVTARRPGMRLPLVFLESGSLAPGRPSSLKRLEPAPSARRKQLCPRVPGAAPTSCPTAGGRPRRRKHRASSRPQRGPQHPDWSPAARSGPVFVPKMRTGSVGVGAPVRL